MGGWLTGALAVLLVVGTVQLATGGWGHWGVLPDGRGGFTSSAGIHGAALEMDTGAIADILRMT